MSENKRVTALDLDPLSLEELDPDLREYFEKCLEKIGFIPNVLLAYGFDNTKLRVFNGFYDDLMLGESRLSKLEREMIAVVVSATNRCVYCMTAHGANLRRLSGDPVFAEHILMNYRAAPLTDRHRAMLDFADQLTRTPDRIEEAHRESLRKAGFTDRDIWDIAAVTGFFNMSNRVATAVDMVPNPEYHSGFRDPGDV